MFGVAKSIRLARQYVGKPAATTYFKSKISGPNDIIPIDDCADILSQLRDLQDEGPFGNIISTNPQLTASLNVQLDKCKDLNVWAEILNEKWAESSPHFLYDFIPDRNSVPQSVTAKSILHSAAMGSISNVTGLNRDNLKEWLNNGIMRSNVLQANEPYSAIESINLLREGGQNYSQINGQPRIGVIDPATITAITLLIQAIIAATIATVTLVSDIRNRRNQLAQVPGLGTTDFEGTIDDWKDFNGDGIVDQTEQAAASILPIGLVALAALLLRKK